MGGIALARVADFTTNGRQIGLIGPVAQDPVFKAIEIEPFKMTAVVDIVFTADFTIGGDRHPGTPLQGDDLFRRPDKQGFIIITAVLFIGGKPFGHQRGIHAAKVAGSIKPVFDGQIIRFRNDPMTVVINGGCMISTPYCHNNIYRHL